MKNNRFAPLMGVLMLAAALMAGCATTPEPQPEPEPTPEVTAPSAEEARQAIEDARAAITRAQAEGAATQEAEQLLADAEAALAAGDTTRAVDLAGQARQMAESALEQKRREQAARPDQYNVVRGDSLWSISGQPDIYGNPYHWPLIYKANSTIIRDPDLIYPGQVFAIDRNATAADMDAAARHARARGAWSLGVVEESDKAYLRR